MGRTHIKADCLAVCPGGMYETKWVGRNLGETAIGGGL